MEKEHLLFDLLEEPPKTDLPEEIQESLVEVATLDAETYMEDYYWNQNKGNKIPPGYMVPEEIVRGKADFTAKLVNSGQEGQTEVALKK